MHYTLQQRITDEGVVRGLFQGWGFTLFFSNSNALIYTELGSSSTGLSLRSVQCGQAADACWMKKQKNKVRKGKEEHDSRLMPADNTIHWIIAERQNIFTIEFKVLALPSFISKRGKYPFALKKKKRSSVLIPCHSAACGWCRAIIYRQGAQLIMPWSHHYIQD